jgi:hypothetical protein
MNHIIAYSGGLSSWATAQWCKKQFGADSIECVFTDTLTEDEDLYRFLDETIKQLGCKFIHLADGRNIWQVFNDVSFMGNSRIDPCSRILKRELFKTYLKDFDPSNTTLYYGIGYQEQHRLIALIERWAPFSVQAPLIALESTKEQILWQLDQIGIKPPRLYDLGFEHNNCGGFCIKTGQRQMLQLLTTLPERYKWHEEEQEKLFTKIGPHGFIRQTINGEMKYLSLKEFRLQVETKQQLQLFQDGACACFS